MTTAEWYVLLGTIWLAPTVPRWLGWVNGTVHISIFIFLKTVGGD